MLPYWPGTDGWPPPLWVWIAAAVLTVVTPVVIWAFGAVAVAVYVVVVIVCSVIGANARLKRIGAEEFWDSWPRDD